MRQPFYSKNTARVRADCGLVKDRLARRINKEAKGTNQGGDKGAGSIERQN
jgi:hypothetical protein